MGRRVRIGFVMTVWLAVSAWSPAGWAQPATAPDVLLILDASGSMWGQIQGENKIVIARRVLKELLGELPAESEVGLVAYGHRREGDCEDIETITPLGPLDAAALSGAIDGLNPKGKTPITRALNEAIETVRARTSPTTVLLVSDGIETCDGNPCDAVRQAKADGVDLLLHVVGFDVGEVDVSQLECAAQAGGGLYFDARDAAELSAALDQAVAAPPEIPPGRLSVKAIANGELADVAIRVTDKATGEDVAGGRTYTGEDTNPRLLPLPDGTFDVVVGAIGTRGDVERRFEIEITEGSTVEKVVDFSTGELSVAVTRNGELGDATVRVYALGTRTEIAAGRTYTHAKSNPSIHQLTAGEYDVVVKAVKISGEVEHRFEGVKIEGGGRTELAHEFSSGTLRLGARRGDELVDATVYVVSVATGKAIAQGRTYTSEKSNPKTLVLPPGTYKATVKAVRLEGKPEREIDVTVEAGETTEHMIDLSP